VDPLLILGIGLFVAAGIVAAAVPKARKGALIALGAIASFIGLRAIDRLIVRGGGVPFTPLPDKETARIKAEVEAKAVEKAQETATEAAPVRDTPPDLDALAERVNDKLDER